jgi:hypothetical protein
VVYIFPGHFKLLLEASDWGPIPPYENIIICNRKKVNIPGLSLSRLGMGRVLLYRLNSTPSVRI